MGSPLNQLAMSLTHLRLKVADADKCSQFYQHFGMKLLQKIASENGSVYMVGYSSKQDTQGTVLEITASTNTAKGKLSQTHIKDSKAKTNCENDKSVYWKIGVNVYDLDLAVKGLRAKKVRMGPVLDIPEVGILCHVFDDEDYDIELMQFTMTGKEKLPYEKQDGCSIGQPATFSVVTIRTSNIQNSLRFYCSFLGMKTLCKQDQSEDYGFDVYYLGFSEESPPNPNDLNDVVNREWTYQRPYTLLEILVYTDGRTVQPFVPLRSANCGFIGLGMGCASLDLMEVYAKEKEQAYTKEYNNIFQAQTITLTDPDLIPVRIMSA